MLAQGRRQHRPTCPSTYGRNRRLLGNPLRGTAAVEGPDQVGRAEAVRIGGRINCGSRPIDMGC